MKYAIARVWLLAFMPLMNSLAPAQTPTEQPLQDGVAISLGGQKVELRVATAHAFRLHIFDPASKPAPTSIFLSGEAQTLPPFTVDRDGGYLGIKTDFGELKIDPDKARWELLDAGGATLADWAALGTGGAVVNSSSGATLRPLLQLKVGANPAQPHPLYYGSGNVPNLGALTQVKAPSRPGNGSTSLPQYWSKAGYGALMISQTDNMPASWTADSAGRITWDFSAQITTTSTGGGADLYVAPAPDLYSWLRDQAELTGFAPVPPRWAFGYMQSRWGWENKKYIDDAFARFRADKLPVDTFIIDFEWYTKSPDYSVPVQGDPNYVDFGWNENLFPDPAKQIADFAQQGLHIVGIRKPRLGNLDNLAMARGKGWILPFNPKDPNGGDSRSRNLDFSNPDVQSYWEENNKKFVEAGMAGFWNDEGETTFTEYSYWNQTEVALFSQVDANARFWSINRSFAPGLQRFGASAWTGDIASDWSTLAKTPGELLSYSLSGMPYEGCDIGGYGGNPTPELLARWMEAGVFFPVCRSHSERSKTPRFPWLYDDQKGPEGQDVQAPLDAQNPGGPTEGAIRKALDLRYRLVPYYYSLAHENHATGAPLMRALTLEFPGDEKAAGMADEWLMGKGLLAAPQLNQGGTRNVYLPQETWFAFGTNQTAAGPQSISVTSKLDEIPIYVRAGTILPLGPVLQYTGQPTTDPLEVQIYPGKDGTFNLVEDDGSTLAYEKGTTRTTRFAWSETGATLSWTSDGPYKGDNLFHAFKAVLFSPKGPVTLDGSLDKPGSLTFP